MKRKDSFLVFFLSLAVLCAALGVWQVKRYHYKNELNATFLTSKKQPILYQGQALESFKIYQFTGYLAKQGLIKFVERPYHGEMVHFIYTVLQTEFGQNFVLELGYIAKDQQINITALEKLRGAKLSLKILGRKTGKSNFFTPENNPENNQWYYVEPQKFAEFFAVPLVSDFYLQLAKSDNILLPEKFKSRELREINNPHLKYIFFWFTITLMIVFLSLNYYRKNFETRTTT